MIDKCFLPGPQSPSFSGMWYFGIEEDDLGFFLNIDQYNLTCLFSVLKRVICFRELNVNLYFTFHIWRMALVRCFVPYIVARHKSS